MAEVRLHYQEDLANLEQRALTGIELVISSLDRTMEAVEHKDSELAELVIADDDRIDGRYLEVTLQQDRGGARDRFRDGGGEADELLLRVLEIAVEPAS